MISIINLLFIILWGDRSSFLWDILLDRSICVDVPYNEYIGYDVTKDKKILDILKKIEKK